MAGCVKTMLGIGPSVAIVGAGPAGATLACLLRQRGLAVYLFNDPVRRPLLVGESLVSAATPILRKIGVESSVAAISHIKLGAGFRHADGTRVDFRFPHYSEHRPGYAYNIPRPQFDDILLQRARALGAHVIQHRAGVGRSASHQREIQLTAESLRHAGLAEHEHPDWLIDASGRARVFSRCLQLPADKGLRNDVAHFAHFRQFDSESAFAGQVLLTAAEHGWFWQIPLPQGLSVGAVMNKQAWSRYGRAPQEQLDNALNAHPLLARAGAQREAISDVASYARYQLISRQAFGRGWVLLGDAFGFVDPMLSPGVYMALESANQLDKVVFSRQTIKPQQLQRYCENLRQWHRAWQSLIEYFYNGKLLTMAAVRQDMLAQSRWWQPGRLMESLVSRALAGMTTGYKVQSKTCNKLFTYSCDHICKNLTEVAHRQIARLPR
ncbi:NAD(P)/FAD-dependent oxidoreductase [Halioxenophilus aromaticivorans]|uniref:Uncharacterized protein n=1 Tax=Halioxenophilus aromaticivorans TaxID=1306992 RepID=A0AAV3U022_9ALTE